MNVFRFEILADNITINFKQLDMPKMRYFFSEHHSTDYINEK